MRTAAPRRGCRAAQLHAAAAPPAAATAAPRVCAARRRGAQQVTRRTAVNEVRGCCAAHDAPRPRHVTQRVAVCDRSAHGRPCTSRLVGVAKLARRGGAVSSALRSPHDRSLPATAARPPRRALTSLQLAQRGGALAATAGEAGEEEAVEGAFFNRQVELKSLATLLAGAPKAVIVMTGPPSCGKSGARALLRCRFCVGLW
jgi:hypothetical protein